MCETRLPVRIMGLITGRFEVVLHFRKHCPVVVCPAVSATSASHSEGWTEYVKLCIACFCIMPSR